MIKPEHLRLHVIRPTLEYLDSVIPYSMAAENLLMGTCAQESEMGKYLVQLDDGPAEGIYQIEPDTHDDIIMNFVHYRENIANKIYHLRQSAAFDSSFDMITNLAYATAMCRVHYWRVAEPLPEHDDIEGMAHYYKAYYNTMKGKATVEEFIGNYERYVK